MSEVMQVLVLSSAHVKRETIELIESSESMCRFVGDYGVILFVSQQGTPPEAVPETEDGYPEDLKNVTQFARSNGFDWVRFDSDGTEEDALPTYAWE